MSYLIRMVQLLIQVYLLLQQAQLLKFQCIQLILQNQELIISK